MKTLTQPFTKSWWKEFLITNKNFTQTCVLKNIIDEKLLEDLNEGVMEVLRERFRLEHMGNGFRAYIDNIEQNDDYAVNLSKTPPLADENITEFTQRIFEKKFGLIINSGEKHSEIISEKIQNAIYPLLEIIGVPASGFEITIFIGNYGWTPLGIHQDHPGENVIHFHLGPGQKTMYIWDEKKYDELTGTKFNNKNVEPIKEYSKEFPFERGDIYYMPWNKYHIGYSDNLSVGITLWFNNPTKETYAKKIIQSFVNQFANEEYKEKTKEIILPEHDFIKNKGSFNDLISTLKINKEILNSNTEDFFKLLHSEFKYSIMSNGGWQSLPLSRTLKEDYDVNNYEHFLHKKIKSKKNFKIHYYLRNNTLIVFSRGTKIEVKHHKELVSIIDNINTHKEYLVIEILENLSKEWPIEAGLYFLSELYNYRGIDIV